MSLMYDIFLLLSIFFYIFIYIIYLYNIKLLEINFYRTDV